MTVLEVFRAGTHIDNRGVSRTFTEQDVRDTARVYNPRLHEAPFLRGHDESLPNSGLVQTCTPIGVSLWVKPHKVDVGFAEDINAGRLPRLSAAFYAPTDPRNPVAGYWYLRHVAAVNIPSVKGMEPPEFAEDGLVVIQFGEAEYSDWLDSQTVFLFRNLREFLIGQFSLEVADRVLPGYAIEGMSSEMMTATPIYEEGLRMTDNARQAELDQREATIAAKEAELKAKDLAEFAEVQVQERRLLPGEKAGVVALMAALPTEGAVEFSEGAAITPLKAFQKFVQGLEARIDYSEKSGGGGVAFSEDPQELAMKARELVDAERDKGRTLSYTDAYNRVRKGK